MAETYYVKPENSPVNDLTLNSGDAMFITNGGTANGTIINSDGAATVNDGGSANNTTVNEGGTLHLIGGAATGVNVEKGGRLEVNKGATATGIEAEKGATLVFDVAADTHIAGTSDGAAFLIQNGIATGFVLETGVLIVSEGGKAVETTLNSAGFINVSQGGSADKAVINTSGELKVSSGGTATEATVKTGGKLTVESSGFCDDATIEMGGNLYVVSSGGTAAGTYIGAMGNLAVSKGGTAYGTTVGAGGFLTVGTKGIAEGADVNGFLNVLDGGTASNVTVNEGAVVYVQSKGTGSDVSVDYGGILEVLSGGRLKGATVDQGGSATIHADVMASNVVVDGGKVTVMSDGWAYQSGVSSNTIVRNGGRLVVSGGGYVVGAAVSAGGHVTVESDATFSSATVADADVTALDGAFVSRLNLEAGGILNVVSGGKAEHINVSAGGVLTGILREASELKFYGGTLDLNIAGVSPDSEALVDEISFLSIMPVAEDYLCTLTVSDTQAEGAYKLIEGASGFDTSKAITVKDTSGTTLGTLTVNGGSTTIGGVNYTLAVTTEDVLTVTIAGGVDLTGDLDTTFELTAGMVGSKVNILDGGKLHVSNGGLAEVTAINAGGSMVVSQGGSASDTTVNNGGKLYVSQGGIASKTELNDGGKLFASGSVGGATVSLGGSMFVSSGATVNDINVSAGGFLWIYDGGTATGIVAAKGAELYFNVAPDTYVKGTYAENAFEMKDATLSDFTAWKKCTVAVRSGGVTSNTTLNDGTLQVDGGVAKDTVVKINGEIWLYGKGSVVSGVTFQDGCHLWIRKSGGKLTGKVTFETGAGVTYSDGASATLDFDLTQTTVGADALVNDLSPVLAAPFDYTLTVDGTEADGDYKLAEGATGFDKTITVKDTLGTTLGTLTVAGGKTTIDGKDYTLTLTGTGSLGVTLGAGGGIPDTTPPDKPIPEASSELPTNGYVTVTATFSDDSVLRECSKDGENWVEYQSSGLTFVENGKAYFRATDGAGNVSDIAVYEVTNIDKVAPTISYITPSTTAPAASVTVTASFDDDVSLASTQYRIGVGAWQDYTTGVTVTENTTVYFKAVDAAGNESEVKEYEVTNIIITGDITGKEYVSSGGMASGATVKAGGSLNILSGGVARDTLINAGGKLTVVKGGKLTGSMTFEDTASVTVQQYGIVDFDISELAPSNAALVNNLSVIQGKPTYTLTVGASQAEGTYTLAGGASSFSSSITVKDTLGTELDKFYSVNQSLIIGGMVYTLTLTDDVLAVTIAGAGGGVDLTGDLDTTSGLAAGMVGSSVNILDGGNLEVSEGGFTSQTTVNSGGDLSVSAGGSANVVTVNFGGDLFVRNGGIATLVKENGGYASVNDGATVTFVSNSFGGYNYNKADDWCTIHSGTTGTDLAVGNDGKITVYDGGVASQTTVNSNGDLAVSEGGVADVVTVNFGGDLYVLNGGVATLVKENGGYVGVDDGATATFVSNSFGGYVYNNADDWCTIHDGTTGSNLTAANKGRIYVYSGGIASDTTVNDKGIVEGNSGGLIDGVVVNSGGSLLIYNGAKLTGQMTFVTGAEVIPFVGSILDFDLTQTAPDAPALVNDLSILMGTPTYTITVDNSQALGTYKLAGGAAGFDKPITVRSIYGEIGCTLTVDGGATKLGDVYLTLALSGSELTVTIGETSEPDTTPPTVTNIKASTTEPTNQNVTVTADFNDNVGLKSKLYQIDGGAWQDYTAGGVVMTKSGTVYFKAVDTSDNESAMWGITVDNIDKVAPTITNITPSTTAPAASVTVTATFADDWELASRQYKIGDGAWTDYVDGVTVTENGTVYFKAVDIAGNEIEDEYTVTNIAAPGEPLNEPDDGWNDYLYDSKNKKWNTEGNIAKFTPNPVSGNCEILLDEPGTVDLEGMHNMFGNDTEGKTGNLDKGDVGKINVTTPAKLSFSVKSTADATFYIYEDGFDKKNNRAQLTVGKVSVKKGKAALLSDICLTTGENKYYAAMVAKNVKKPGPSAIYNVFVVDSTVFVDADGGWNNEATNGGVVDNPFTVKRGVKTVKLDNTAMIDSGDYNNFVGFSDEVDYAKLDLVTTTYLSFDVGTNGSTKFTLWKRDTNSGKLSKVGGVTTLKSKNGELAAKSTKAQLLEVSDKYEYFVSMESKDAGKGGSAYYNVDINTVSTRFFDSADGGANNWLFNKKDREYNSDDNLHENTLSASGDHSVILDDNEIGDTAFKNFVGFKDSADYAKVVLTAKGTLSFRITALADVSFELWRKDKDGKDRNILTSLQKKTDVKVKDYAVGASATTDALTLDAGDYYISVTAKSTKANEKGSAFYNVTAIFSSAEAGSLAMPETDALAGASLDSYLDSASDKLFGETGGSLLA